MKKLLTVYTGGTIGTVPTEKMRELNAALAKETLAESFAASGFADVELCDSGFPKEERLLSENMTLARLESIARHIRSFDEDRYAGIIVFHGTDTLAYTAAFLSFLFCNARIPIMLVSGNKPPSDPTGNANVNFRAAVELILAGIAPNVYVPYRNADGRLYLHVGSTLLQCADFSDDFFSASPDRAFLVDEADDRQGLLEQCRAYSARRAADALGSGGEAIGLEECVLRIDPYVGLDYRRIDLRGIRAVVHGTYHSGTVCVERACPTDGYSSRSILWLAKRCRELGVPLYLAPSHLGADQYSSVYDAVRCGEILPLSMTAEAAYAKLTIGASLGFSGEMLRRFMSCEISSEFI